MPYWRLHYHLVWCTHNRESLISDAEETIIKRSLAMTCDDMGLIRHAVGIMPDHVHIALSIPPRNSVSEVMKRLKGASSHAVRAQNPDFAWQAEYGALSFGDRALPRVRDYVENQRQHHDAKTTIFGLERVDPER